MVMAPAIAGRGSPGPDVQRQPRDDRVRAEDPGCRGGDPQALWPGQPRRDPVPRPRGPRGRRQPPRGPLIPIVVDTQGAPWHTPRSAGVPLVVRGEKGSRSEACAVPPL